MLLVWLQGATGNLNQIYFGLRLMSDLSWQQYCRTESESDGVLTMKSICSWLMARRLAQAPCSSCLVVSDDCPWLAAVRAAACLRTSHPSSLSSAVTYATSIPLTTATDRHSKDNKTPIGKMVFTLEKWGEQVQRELVLDLRKHP